MLSSIYRFHGHGSLRYVYKNGTAIRSRLITVKYTHNPHRKRSRFSVVVSKKVHKRAVGRNRIRRRVYEVIRENISDITTPYDIVIIVTSNEILDTPHKELKDLINGLLKEITVPSVK